MKPILAAMIAVPLIGLVIVGPLAFALLVMIAPLVLLALVCAWALARGSGAAFGGRRHRRQPAEHGRHVVTR
jgi:predicted membrane metal-binding protein